VKGHSKDFERSFVATTEPPVETAKRIVAEIDTYGDPRLYALAEEYLRLRAVVDALLPANGCHTVEEALRGLT
jgi:hypothetical protein